MHPSRFFLIAVSILFFGSWCNRAAAQFDSATTFDQWQSYYFYQSQIDSGLASEQATPAGDGVANLLKYAAGLYPFTPATQPATLQGLDAQGHLTLSFTRRKVATDLIFTPQASYDLQTWQSGGDILSQVNATDLGNGFETVTVSDAATTHTYPSRFLRLSVTRNPVAAGAPAPPSDLVATPLASSWIELTWSNNSANEDGFYVERRNADGTWSVVETVPPGVSQRTDVKLQASQLYDYRIRSFNSAGISNPSNEAAASTTPTPPPGSPALDDPNGDPTVTG